MICLSKTGNKNNFEFMGKKMTDASRDITILLVEDAAMMRKIEVKTLRALGFNRIIEAVDGIAAIACLQEHKQIDLVISDWNMPNMDGRELAVWMRSSGEPYQNIPFLMATGQGDKKQEKKALGAGINSFIAKPFNENELKTKIEEALGLVREEQTAKQVKQRPRLAESGKVLFRIAHIQITDHIILGVLKHLIDKGKLCPQHFELETVCMPGWNPVQQTLESGEVDGAFILAPIAMDLFSDGADIKLVLLAHKNGSIMVRSNSGAFDHPHQDFFKNKSFLIPHKMSAHHMLAHLFFSGIGLQAGMGEDEKRNVAFEVAAPVKMQEAIENNPDISGFFVAEPLGTRAIASGAASLQLLSSELWENHPCCVVTLKNEVITSHADAVYELVDMLVHAGKYVSSKPESAAEIAVEFLDPDKKLGLKVPVIKNVITEEKGISTSDLFPDVHALEQMNAYMHDRMGIGARIRMDKFVDARFAEAACKDRLSSHKKSHLHNSKDHAAGLLVRNEIGKTGESKSKSMLNLEGKYLTFTLGKEEYGIDIMQIREIIGMLPIRSIPRTPDHIRGVINSRGRVIPVMDLKRKFEMGEVTENERSCIVILESRTAGLTARIGLAVDSVSEVTAIKAVNIEAKSVLGNFADTRHILGVAKLGNKVKLLLNVNYIVSQEDMAAASETRL
jgi:chemotaxis signal transduction protein/CheY-like chemotaxis protein